MEMEDIQSREKRKEEGERQSSGESLAERVSDSEKYISAEAFHGIAERAYKLEEEAYVQNAKREALEKVQEKLDRLSKEITLKEEVGEKSRGFSMADLYGQLGSLKPEYVQQAIREYLEAEKAKCNIQREDIEKTEENNKAFLETMGMLSTFGKSTISGYFFPYAIPTTIRKCTTKCNYEDDHYTLFYEDDHYTRFYGSTIFGRIVGGLAGLISQGVIISQYGWKAAIPLIAGNLVSAGYEFYRLRKVTGKKKELNERESKMRELEDLLKKNEEEIK